MFAGEVDSTLRNGLVAAESGVLADFVGAVAAAQVRIAGGIAKRGESVVMGADAWPDDFQLLKELLGVPAGKRGTLARGVRSSGLKGSAPGASGVVGEQAIQAGLGAAAVPCALKRQIGLDEAISDSRPRTAPIAVTIVELENKFRVGAVSELLNCPRAERSSLSMVLQLPLPMSHSRFRLRSTLAMS